MNAKDKKKAVVVAVVGGVIVIAFLLSNKKTGVILPSAELDDGSSATDYLTYNQVPSFSGGDSGDISFGDVIYNIGGSVTNNSGGSGLPSTPSKQNGRCCCDGQDGGIYSPDDGFFSGLNFRPPQRPTNTYVPPPVVKTIDPDDVPFKPYWAQAGSWMSGFTQTLYIKTREDERKYSALYAFAGGIYPLG